MAKSFGKVAKSKLILQTSFLIYHKNVKYLVAKVEETTVFPNVRSSENQKSWLKCKVLLAVFTFLYNRERDLFSPDLSIFCQFWKYKLDLGNT